LPGLLKNIARKQQTESRYLEGLTGRCVLAFQQSSGQFAQSKARTARNDYGEARLRRPISRGCDHENTLISATLLV
jgi:hypothetical protein